jgi:hypothetical protein
MYPPLAYDLARARMVELDRQARRFTRHAARCNRPARRRRSCRALKERAGWALIHAGLRLTGPPAASQP